MVGDVLPVPVSVTSSDTVKRLNTSGSAYIDYKMAADSVAASVGKSSTSATDGTHGTPRTGYITSGPRAGKYKIIKVI
jgi:hypothetical protein